jgi:hypothetical protein
MRVQAFYFFALFSLESLSAGADISRGAEKGCFDFAEPLRRPLIAVMPLRLRLSQKDGISEISDEISDGQNWAAVRGEVARPILEVLKDLEAHQVTKSASASAEILDIADSRFLSRQSVKFRVTPFPLMHVDWTEDWAFSGLKTDSRGPAEILVAYEKTQGTSYIRHLCGNYILERLGPARTGVFIYEEAQATRRSRKDTLDGVRATLQKLQKPRIKE